MNQLKNGSVAVGAPGSEARILAEWEDALIGYEKRFLKLSLLLPNAAHEVRAEMLLELLQIWHRIADAKFHIQKAAK